MRSHPPQVSSYHGSSPSVRRSRRVRRYRFRWVWAVLALNTGCLILGVDALRRQSVPQSVSTSDWRSPLLASAAMLIPSSYAAPAPSPSASLSLESLSALPSPSAESSSGSESSSTGDRIFLSYGEWLKVLKQEADAIAIAKPKKLAILAGDSISLWFPTDLLPGDRTWLNQGISGETSAGLLKRLSLFEATQPDSVFVMIGINDLIKGYSTDTVFANQELIIEDLLEYHPDTQIVIQSVLPHAGEAATWEGRDRLLKVSNDDIRVLNEQLAGLSDRYDQVKYLDLYKDFADPEGNLRMDLSTDGLHLNEKGYQLWRQVLQAYSLTAEHDLVENQ